MKKKKMTYIAVIIATLLLVSLVAFLIVFSINMKQKDTTTKPKEEKIKSEDKFESKDNNNEEENESLGKEETTPSVNQEQEKPNENKNIISQPEPTKPKDNNTTSSNVNKPSQNEVPTQHPQCTPKKFTMNWVRADFESFSECTTMGDKYKENGYGYFCDSYQDDCNTTYYMLTIYERNSGIEYDYHTIKIPSN